MNRFSTLSVTAACVAVSTLGTSARAAISTFNLDAQGWTVADTAGAGDYSLLIDELATVWSATSGNPGGGISASDTTDFTIMFRAPDAYRGNRSASYGGDLRFDITSTHDTWTQDTVVILKGANMIIVAQFTLPTVGQWNTVTIPLVASSFFMNNAQGAAVSETDFLAVLADVDEFWINAEYGDGLIETTTLDNVYFPVPAPAAIALAPLGLLLLRRR
jgi:hypothetical protein